MHNFQLLLCFDVALILCAMFVKDDVIGMLPVTTACITPRVMYAVMLPHVD